MSTLQKYKFIAEKMGQEIDMLFVSTLDDVAWLLNLRGADMVNMPVFKAKLMVRKKLDGNINCNLFIDERKVADVKHYLKKIGVTVHKPENLHDYLAELKQKKIKIDPYTCNADDYYAMHKNIDIELIHDNRLILIADLKKIKNEGELSGMRAANLRDCAALVRFSAWLEKETKSRSVDEYEAA